MGQSARQPQEAKQDEAMGTQEEKSSNGQAEAASNSNSLAPASSASSAQPIESTSFISDSTASGVTSGWRSSDLSHTRKLNRRGTAHPTPCEPCCRWHST